MAASWGDVVGTSVSTAVSPASLMTAGETRATPLTSASSLPIASLAVSSSVPDAPWTVSTMGAEKPGPNPSASRS